MNSDHLRRKAMANSKDVVVTGVSTGIGWGTTKVLVSKGFRVFGSVRKQADADRLQSEFGNGFMPLMMDITAADAVHQAALKVGSMIGGRNLVGLVNNAGIVVSGPLLLSEFKPTEYWEAVQNFQKFIVTEASTNGLPPERLGEAVHVALTTAKPKARYAVVPQRFKNWTLPRLLPTRLLDAYLAKMMGLTKATKGDPPS